MYTVELENNIFTSYLANDSFRIKKGHLMDANEHTQLLEQYMYQKIMLIS